MIKGETAGNLLVVGGSYFLGKSFLSMVLDKRYAWERIFVVNRGSRPLPERAQSDPRVTLVRADRRDAEALSPLAGVHFNAVVDFCGYNASDIRFLTEQLSGGIGRYVFVSTVDALARGTGRELDEAAPLEDREFPGETGAYISGKVALERELVSLHEETGLPFTIVRPAIIYGPGNYAPREGMYFHWIRGAKDGKPQIIHPADATGHFQMVYADDVARFLAEYALRGEAENEVFHLCGTKTYTYDSYAELLEHATGLVIERVPMPVADLIARGIPLPFPYYAEESETYADTKSIKLGFRYTSDILGMQESYQDSSLRSE